MTTYEKWSLFIAIGGFAVVVWSLRLLTNQTRFVAKTLKAALLDSLINRQYEIDRLFIDRPEMRKYFYDGAEVPPRDSVEYPQVMATAEYILDFFSISLIQKDNYPDLLPKDWWLSYMKDLFANSPVLCEVLEQRKGWYRKEELHNLKRQALESGQNIKSAIGATLSQSKAQ